MGMILVLIAIMSLSMAIVVVVNTLMVMNPQNKVSSLLEDAGWGGISMSGFLTVVGIVIAVAIVLTSTSSVNSKVAFYDTNASVYREAVALAKEGVERSQESTFVEGANFEQVKAFIDTVNDMRGDVQSFNRGIVSHRYWQDSFMFGMFWRNLPDRIKPIEQLE